MKKVLLGMAFLLVAGVSCTQKSKMVQAEASADTDSIIRINCMVDVTSPNREAVIALSKELVDSSRKDVGNISYDLMKSATDSSKMMIFETWKNQPSLDKHSASAHFKRLVPKIQKLAKMDVQIFKMKKS